MTNLKHFCALSLSAMTVAFTSLPTLAIDGLSANVSATSNYLWRGLEQTNGKAAISGGIDFEQANGFYVGTWVSNADWAEGMTYELDFYAGFAGNSGMLSYDIGFIQYAYPEAIEDVDFSEVYGNISYGAFTLAYATLVNAHASNFGDDSYISLDGEFSLTEALSLTVHIGKGTDDFYAGEAFIDYGLMLNKDNFTFGASKTDLSNDDLTVYVTYTIDIAL